MAAPCDTELRQREHEFNLRMDEMRAVMLSVIKGKTMSKQTQYKATEGLQVSKEFCEKTQTQLQHHDLEIKVIIANKDYRIKELEEELKCMQSKIKEEREDHIKKYQNVSGALRRRDAELKAQRQAHSEQLQKAKEHIIKLQDNMEVLAAQARSLQDDRRQQQQETIQRISTELEATRTQWEKYMRQVSSEMVALQEREAKLRTELQRSREQTERYKQQLSAGLRREKVLEQSRVQTELEWQRRCEDVKAEVYLANEHLIQDLIQAREQAEAELMERKQELHVRRDGDQAIQGLTPEAGSLASEELRCLQEQNNTLRAVVTQMRKDMENLSHLLVHRRPEPLLSCPQSVQDPESSARTQMAPGPPDPCSRSLRKDSLAELAPDCTEPVGQQATLSSKQLKEQLGGATGLSGLASVSQKPTAEPEHTAPDGTQPENPAALCLGERASTSAVTKQDRATRLESAFTNTTRQNAPMQQVPKEKKSLKPGVMFEGVFKSDHHRLHSRLKQAASVIARLSREKQQLIEMGNRLRADITTVGAQEPVQPEKDTSTEQQGNQQDRLSVLEQLQYQLTTQELQFAVRQRTCTTADQLLPGTNCHSPFLKGTASTCQEHKARDVSESSRNPENTLQLSLPQSQPHSGLSTARLLSEESLCSLTMLWDTLDRGLRDSLFSEGEHELNSRKEVAESDGSGVQMMVRGSGLIPSQPPADVQQRRKLSKTLSSTAKTNRPAVPVGVSKIRNYNIKD